MNFPLYRSRRLRRTPALRALVRETELSTRHLVLPLFVCEGRRLRRPIGTMPGQFQLSVDELLKEASEAFALGVPAVILFGIPDKKDERASSSCGIVPKAVRVLKKELPELIVVADVCLCEYMSHGHCGIVHGGRVDNDATLPLLAKAALAYAEAGADIVIMVHPDYQYTPKLIPAMAAMISGGLYSCVLGSRILGGYALKGGMPIWKYIANRFLTLAENILIGAKLSEYHTGYRAFSRKLLLRLPLENNSDDFVFDNQMLTQIIWFGYTVAEVSCPTSYFPEASSINLTRSIKYGFGCLKTAWNYRLAKMKIMSCEMFPGHE